MTKTKFFAPFAVKAVNDEQRTFSALVSTWDEDLGRDVIHLGAFARTLDHWKSSNGKKPIFLIDQHDYRSVRNVLGKMIEAEETAEGLRATFQVIEGPDGDEALRRIKGGFVTGMSIGYQAVKWENVVPPGKESWEAIRHLHELKLFEVSLVIFPMNEGAVIDSSSVKSLLHAVRDPEITDEQKTEVRAELKSLREQIDALLRETEPAPPEPKDAALAPDAPERLQMEAVLRDITIRSLATA